MKLICLFLLCIILHSCNQDASQEKENYVDDSARVSNNTIASQDSSNLEKFADSLPDGAYQGIFPCTGCKGLQQTVIFYNDKTYEEEQSMLGKNNSLKKGSGTWELNNNKIELKKNNQLEIVLLKKKDSLFFMRINGVTVKYPFKYLLTKKNLADSNILWKKKKAEGIDFIAMGTKPSWNIEIKHRQHILFKLSEWKKPLIVTPESPLINNDSIFYVLKKDTTRWTITIFPQICRDGMSDTLYRYKVNVNYKGFIYQGCGVMLSKKKLAIKLSKVHSVHKMKYHLTSKI